MNFFTFYLNVLLNYNIKEKLIINKSIEILSLKFIEDIQVV
jgi:hypothetical protein